MIEHHQISYNIPSQENFSYTLVMLRADPLWHIINKNFTDSTILLNIMLICVRYKMKQLHYLHQSGQMAAKNVTLSRIDVLPSASTNYDECTKGAILEHLILASQFSYFLLRSAPERRMLIKGGRRHKRIEREIINFWEGG